MSDVPPAGWYPDPADESRQRYWDGTAWTPHTGDPRPGSLPTAATPSGGAPAGGREVATWTWQSVVVTFLCCGGVFSIVGLFNAGRAEGALRAGDTAAAREYARKARSWTLVGLALGLLAATAIALSFGSFVASMSDGCADAEPGTARYDFCVGACSESTPALEGLCDGFTP